MEFLRKIRIGMTKPSLVGYHLFRKKHKWKESKGGLTKKEYSNYREYLEHQKNKLRKKDLDDAKLLKERDLNYRNVLRERLKRHKIIKPGMSVLCLAARIGTEVKSFLDLRCFAIGIDLYPAEENKYVVYGDFHHLVFPRSSVDVVFSNSLDHALDLEKLIGEIKRVLKPGGYLILEISDGEKENNPFKYYESTKWDKIDDVLDVFLKSGFGLIKKLEIDNYPFKGQHVCFKLDKRKS